MTIALSDVFGEIGMDYRVWDSPDGSKAMLLPYGGRILALFSPDSTRNFFWTHPALQSIEMARDFYRGSEWHNSGGDRTWLAPETEFFFPNYPCTDIYLQPRQLESAKFDVSATPDGFRMVNRFSVMMYAAKSNVQLTLTKELTQAVNPLLEIGPKLASAIDYAGYALTTTLNFTECGTLSPVGIWNLLQLPYGGEMMIPTRSRLTPVVFMGAIPEIDLCITKRLVRYRLAAQGEHKFGVPPALSTGIAAYLYPVENSYSLIIRSFVVDPLGYYVDHPRGGLQEESCAVQACSINSGLGAFAELEYHTPAIGGSTGYSRREDESRVWAFRGQYSDISKIANLLVSSEINF